MSGCSSSGSSTAARLCSWPTTAPALTSPVVAANIAALVETVAAVPGRRILNSADPDAPSALEISRAIAAHLGHAWDEVLLDDDAAYPALGAHLWDAADPIVLDMTAAAELGYTPAGDYAATVAEAVDWLVSAARGGEGAARLPGPDDPFFAPLLDYAAEDRYLATSASGGRLSPGPGAGRLEGRAAGRR